MVGGKVREMSGLVVEVGGRTRGMVMSCDGILGYDPVECMRRRTFQYREACTALVQRVFSVVVPTYISCRPPRYADQSRENISNEAAPGHPNITI